MIVQIRRQLVDQGNLDPLLQGMLDSIANTGNSLGESPRKRSAWTRELEFKVKDMREAPAEVLWFVGDYCSFDPRNQKVSQTVARLLRAAWWPITRPIFRARSPASWTTSRPASPT